MVVITIFEVPYCGYNIRNPDYDIIDRPHGSDSYLFLYFKSSMNILIDNKKVLAGPGTMILYTPEYRQWYQAKNTFYNSFIHFNGNNEFIKNLNLTFNKLFTITKVNEINELIRNIESEYQHREHFWQENISANVQLLLIMLSRSLNKPSLSSDVDPYTLESFFKLRMYILSNLDHDWNSTNMANLANMSTTQFYHYYTYIFKQTPKAELINARMEYSKFLLTNRALPVKQIANIIGYSNESHYIRLFKKYYGISPKQYALNYYQRKTM